MASIRLTPEQDQQLQEARKRTADSTNVLNESSQDIREGRIDIFDQIARYSGGTASVMFTFLGVLIGLKNGQAHIDGSFIVYRSSIQNWEPPYNHIPITQNEIDKLVEEVNSMMTEQTIQIEFI